MAYNPDYPYLTSINFTVRNISPQRKRLTVFGAPIEYLQTRNLLRLDGVSEDLIRQSLVKGELANKIRVGALEIVSTSINLLQFDAEQKAFIDSANEDPGQPLPGTDPVTQCGPPNGGGGGYIDVTYSELTALIAANNLVKGAYYQITDFRTCYDRPDYNYNKTPIFTGNYNTSEIHPIVVLAISENKLAVDAYQPDYPNDKIKYDVTWNTTEITGGAAYGRITERIDEFNNRTDYDHRTIEFKRYRVNYYSNTNQQLGTVQLLSDGTINGASTNFTSLTVGDVIAIPASNEKFYKIASIDSNTLMTVTGINITATGAGAIFFIANTGARDSYYQSNVHLASDFSLYTTFGDAIDNAAAFNNYVGDYSNAHIIWGTGDFLLANNVFKRGEYINNNIGNSSYNNTFNDNCNNNKIGDYFYNNITDDDFDSNVIGSNFNNNLITANFQYNQIGVDFENNIIINNGFYRNNIGNNFRYNWLDTYDSEFGFENNFIGNEFNNNYIYFQFRYNSILEYFENNNIYSSFYYNNVKNNFNYNTIGDSDDIGGSDFYKNDIENEVKSNSFTGDTYKNILGNNFAVNIVGNHFYNNLFGNDCVFNDLGNYFAFNKIGNNFSYNEIDDDFGFGGALANGNIIGNCFDNNIIGEYFYNNVVVDNFHNNTVGRYFRSNEVKSYYLNNINFVQNYGNIQTFTDNVGSSIPGIDGTYTDIPGFYVTEGTGYNATFDIVVSGSVVTSVVVNNPGFEYNTSDQLIILGSQFGGTDGNDLLINVTGISNEPAVYGSYNCTIFKNSTGNNKLSYYDGTDTLVVIDINL